MATMSTPTTPPASQQTGTTQDSATPTRDFTHEDAHRQAHQGLERHDTIVEGHDEKERSDVITRVVVIALDHSKNSDKAFHWALDNFLNPNSDLAVLINVRPAAVVMGAFGAPYMDYTDYIVELDEKNRHEAHQLLQYYAHIVKRRGIAVKAIAMRGDPRDEIPRKAEEVNADALILGSRGMGAFRRAILGSVSDHCIHHCVCPVIIIKDTDTEKSKQTATTSTATSTTAVARPAGTSTSPAKTTEQQKEDLKKTAEDVQKKLRMPAPGVGGGGGMSGGGALETSA